MIIQRVKTETLSINDSIHLFNKLPWEPEKKLTEELVDYVTHGLHVEAIKPNVPFVFNSSIYRAVPNSEIMGGK